MVYSPVLERKKDTIEGCDVSLNLQNKEQILFCIENILTDSSDVMDEKRRNNYKDLCTALSNNTLQAKLFIDKERKKMSCVYTALIGGDEVEIMRGSGGVDNTAGGPFSGYAFDALEMTWGDCRNRLDSLFSYVSSGRRYPTTIPRESQYTQLQGLLQSGLIYAMYDNETMRAYISSQKSGNEQIIASTATELRDLFNTQPSLEGAYKGGGSWYYKYGLQNLGEYKQAVENEYFVIEQLQRYICKNTVSLCCGTNYQVDSKIVGINTTVRDIATMVGPMVAAGYAHLFSRLVGVSLEIEIIYWLSILWAAGAAKVLPHLHNKNETYIGIDSDGQSTRFIKEKLREGENFRAIKTIQYDIFEFLKNYGNDILRDVSGDKTFSLVGGTYGNFTPQEKKTLITGLQKQLQGRDNVLITFFQKPHTEEEKKRHIDLYDNPYQRAWTSDYLHHIGFQPGSFTLKYIYNDATHAVENYLCMHETICLVGEKTTKEYEAGKEYKIHTSARMSDDDIIKEFGDDFALEKVVYSEDGLTGAIVLKKAIEYSTVRAPRNIQIPLGYA